MRKIFSLIIWLLILFSKEMILRGQEIAYDSEAAIILKDTLWLGLNFWKEANLYKDEGFYLKKEEAENVEFYSITVLKYNERVLQYSFDKDFKSILSLYSNRVAGFILYKNQIVGFMYGYKRDNGRWIPGPIDIFPKQSLLKSAIEEKYLGKNNEFYYIYDNGLICYNTFHDNYIYDIICERFIKAEDFIKIRSTQKALHDSYFKQLRDTSHK